MVVAAATAAAACEMPAAGPQLPAGDAGGAQFIYRSAPPLGAASSQGARISLANEGTHSLLVLDTSASLGGASPPVCACILTPGGAETDPPEVSK